MDFKTTKLDDVKIASVSREELETVYFTCYDPRERKFKKFFSRWELTNLILDKIGVSSTRPELLERRYDPNTMQMHFIVDGKKRGNQMITEQKLLDFLEELDEEIELAKERQNESKKFINSYGHGQDTGECLSLKRVKERLLTGEWPEF